MTDMSGRLSKTGVSLDWKNEVALHLPIIYRTRGIGAVAENIRQHPIRTYEERRDELVSRGSGGGYQDTEAEYAVTGSNYRAVDAINRHVSLLNAPLV